jgi:hypothetical protein
VPPYLLAVVEEALYSVYSCRSAASLPRLWDGDGSSHVRTCGDLPGFRRLVLSQCKWAFFCLAATLGQIAPAVLAMMGPTLVLYGPGHFPRARVETGISKRQRFGRLAR